MVFGRAPRTHRPSWAGRAAAVLGACTWVAVRQPGAAFLTGNSLARGDHLLPLSLGLSGPRRRYGLQLAAVETQEELSTGTSSSSSSSPRDWAAQYVKAEISKSPVVIFVDSSSPLTSPFKARLRDANVHFQVVEVDRLDELAPPLPGKESWSDLILSTIDELGAELPALFVGGQLREIPARREELIFLCAGSGAQWIPPEEKTNMTWSKEGVRWKPPKNINGRRFYGDEAGMETYPGEAWDEKRIRYNELATRTSIDNLQRSQVSNAGRELLRLDAGLDKPRPDGTKPEWPPWGHVDLWQRYDILQDTSIHMWGIEANRSYWVDDKDAKEYGIPLAQLRWIFTLSRQQMINELGRRGRRRQHDKIITALETSGLREALIDELRAEQAFSPTGLGVVPGLVQELNGEELFMEIEADTDVPLLVEVYSSKLPGCRIMRKEVYTASSYLFKTVRMVRIDGHTRPEVLKKLGVARFPTLVWLQSRNGEVIHREVGQSTWSFVVARTHEVLGIRALPEGEQKEALALLPASPLKKQPLRTHFEHTQNKERSSKTLRVKFAKF